MSFLNKTIAPVLFPSILWRTSEQSIHLTFDDGPHPTATPRVLKILRQQHIKATFFLVGQYVQQQPELAREIVSEGHSVGNHSYTHPVLFLKSLEFQRQEIRRTNEIIQETVKVRPRGFRPPYGYFDYRTLRIVKTEDQRVVMWDVDGRDFSTKQPGPIIRRVTNNISQGSVILLHDNDSTAGSTLDYLQPLLEDLMQRGFRFSLLPL
jgi:peptidoglycan/xylan/chitin deacetylase (PgdA/CDA1 family)